MLSTLATGLIQVIGLLVIVVAIGALVNRMRGK